MESLLWDHCKPQTQSHHRLREVVMSMTFQLLLLFLLVGIVRADAASRAYENVTDGPHSCGGVDIPYPFGIADGVGHGDFRDGFDVICDAGKPFLATSGDKINIPIGNFSVKTAEARVWLPVGWQCYDSSGMANGSAYTTLQFSNQGVYRISDAKNYLFVLGCSTLGFLYSQPDPAVDESNVTTYSQLTGCFCYCNNSQSAVDGACSGVGCCHADIPPDLVDNAMDFNSYNHTDKLNFSSCDYAFLAEKDSYTFHNADLKMDLRRNKRLMPVRLNWAIRDNLTCKQARKTKEYACISSNSRCLNSTNGPGYICSCRRGYEGNPYVTDGCTDINECEHQDHYPCKGVCTNKQGFYKCTCPKHSHSADPFKEPCSSSFPLKAKIITGSLGGLFILAIMVFFWLLDKEKRKRIEYFEKNGGPRLKKLNYIKLFKKDVIRKIKKKNDVIGEGGYGKVYKGCIDEDNNQLVAMKEPKNVSSLNNEQFANEIIIQSQVIHKNIVKLVGCCLEVDVPILVYEYVPKGSLDDILHGNNKVSLSMGRRLQIAAESAEGLAYMHSKTATTILHGDVKPSNILLNDEFVPKISDFGISRLIVTNVQHTERVIGDKSYMDPVYFQTGLLSDKSDVYSFGVVLLELITRKKASHVDKNKLIKKFIDAYEEDKFVTELLDKELAEIDDPELLHSLTEMIKQCLSFDVHQRPKMTDLAERLCEMVKRSHGK